ncbi:MAG: 4-hydroxythreonine-4-phosphate dehydrogenase PdxA [Paracoccaceae bacterium]
MSLPLNLPLSLPLAISMGDPAGIGPEIALRAVEAGQNAVILGDMGVLQAAAARINCTLPLRAVTAPEHAQAGEISVVETSALPVLPAFGAVSAIAGQAAYDAILAGINLAKSGHVAGLVTAPIHKEALAAAGIAFPGHTEMLAHFSGRAKVAMMLVNDAIRTVLVTIHLSLRDAIAAADFSANLAAIRLAHQGCRALGISAPRVAVAGLNPHAGEGGLFGREEIEIIAPAIKAARDEGIDATGPWPGDTVFMSARLGKFDVVVAQYHDQGLIPVKYMGLDEGVNVTLGLPFVRTSPDHGTAFDIAGQNLANPASLIRACTLARQLALAAKA